MNRKLEDQIQQLAFGELSERETQSLRKAMDSDADAQKALREYQTLNGAMGVLNDVPADQLSKERLKARILRDGLKPRRTAWDLGWLWMPATAAALVFGVYVMKRGVAPAEPRLMLPSTVAVASDVAKPVLEARTPKAIEMPVASTPVDTPVVEEAVYVPEPAKHVRHHKRHAAKRVADSAQKETLLAFKAPQAPAAAPAFAPAKDAAAEVAKAPATESIVMISTDSDASTGALHATEQLSGAESIGG